MQARCEGSGRQSGVCPQPAKHSVLVATGIVALFGMEVREAGAQIGAPHNVARARYADLDGDGISDLVLGSEKPNSGTGKLVLHFMGSDMLPKRSEVMPLIPMSSLLSYEIGDFNGDGAIDLCMVGPMGEGDLCFDGELCVFLNDGKGTLEKAQGVPLTISYVPARGLALSDFNEDGRLDAVIATGQSVLFFPGRGDGTFSGGRTIPETFQATNAVVPGDFDGDGHTDIVVVDGKERRETVLGTFQVFLGNGRGSFALVHEEQDVGLWPVEAWTGDWDGDGRLDVAVRNSGTGFDQEFGYAASSICLYRGAGDGRFALVSQQEFEHCVSGFCAADMNADGRTDIVVGFVASPDLVVVVSLGEGRFERLAPVKSGTWTTALCPADVNGDGAIDVLACHSSIFPGSTFEHTRPREVTTHVNDGTGKLSEPVLSPSGEGKLQFRYVPGPRGRQYSWIVRDLDGDGYPDIATVGPGGEVLIHRGFGDGTFDEQPIATIPGIGNDAPASGESGNFDGDEIPDFVVGTREDDAKLWLILRGRGRLEHVDLPLEIRQFGAWKGTAIGLRSLVVADFDGNGFDEVIIGRSWRCNDVAALPHIYSTEDGKTFGRKEAFPSLLGPPNVMCISVQGPFDANSDGNPDWGLVPRYSCTMSTDLAYICLGSHGATSFEYRGPIPLPPYGPIHFSDLDGDGSRDVVSGGGLLPILAGHSPLVREGESALESFGFGRSLSSVVLADFDGDGLEDCAYVNGRDDAEFFLGDPGRTFVFDSTLELDRPSATMTVAVDVTGDGLPDIIGSVHEADDASRRIFCLVNVTTSNRPFVRGDANADRDFDLADAITILGRLFAGERRRCDDADDVNDNGQLEIGDPVYLLNYLFGDGPEPPPPFPDPGVDPTDDGLGCLKW